MQRATGELHKRVHSVGNRESEESDRDRRRRIAEHVIRGRDDLSDEEMGNTLAPKEHN